MQDEVNEKTVSLCIRCGKVTANLLKAAMKKALVKMEQEKQKLKGQKQPKQDKEDKTYKGKQSMDKLMKQNVQLSNIEDHFKEGTLSELAVEMKVDVYWLSREIKKKSGKTYKELLQEKRMQQAVYLLINSRIAVSDIIEAVGYDNTSYFYRKFKERYGISPKEYRIENMN